MSQARCTLQVKGLDCPNEVGAIRAALEDQPGITGLGFDLIHGMMTVDIGDSVVEQSLPALLQESRRML